MTPTSAPPAAAPPADDPVNRALADPALRNELRNHALAVLGRWLADKPVGFRRQEAEEVADQALTTACGLRHKYDPTAGTVAGWVHGILVKSLYSHARAVRRRPQQPADGGWDALAARLDPSAADAWHDAAVYLAALTPAERDLLTLRYRDGLDPDEIAARLGVSPGAARVRLCRALAAARAAAEVTTAEERP